MLIGVPDSLIIYLNYGPFLQNEKENNFLKFSEYYPSSVYI